MWAAAWALIDQAAASQPWAAWWRNTRRAKGGSPGTEGVAGRGREMSMTRLGMAVLGRFRGWWNVLRSGGYSDYALSFTSRKASLRVPGAVIGGKAGSIDRFPWRGSRRDQ